MELTAGQNPGNERSAIPDGFPQPARAAQWNRPRKYLPKLWPAAGKLSSIYPGA